MKISQIILEQIKANYNSIATILFALFIFLAHVFADSNYDWTKNTISDLGAQAYSKKFIMQIGFIVFGITIVFGIILKGFSWQNIAIFIYGFCIAMTGIFCTKPFTEIISYSISESNLHSFFAQFAGFSFSIGILFQLFNASENSEKWIHFIFFILVIGFSITFGLIKNYQGVVQRLMYVTSFFWLLRFYKV